MFSQWQQSTKCFHGDQELASPYCYQTITQAFHHGKSFFLDPRGGSSCWQLFYSLLKKRKKKTSFTLHNGFVKCGLCWLSPTFFSPLVLQWLNVIYLFIYCRYLINLFLTTHCTVTDDVYAFLFHGTLWKFYFFVVSNFFVIRMQNLREGEKESV